MKRDGVSRDVEIEEFNRNIRRKLHENICVFDCKRYKATLERRGSAWLRLHDEKGKRKEEKEQSKKLLRTCSRKRKKLRS